MSACESGNGRSALTFRHNCDSSYATAAARNAYATLQCCIISARVRRIKDGKRHVTTGKRPPLAAPTSPGSLLRDRIPAARLFPAASTLFCKRAVKKQRTHGIALLTSRAVSRVCRLRRNELPSADEFCRKLTGRPGFAVSLECCRPVGERVFLRPSCSG